MRPESMGDWTVSDFEEHGGRVDSPAPTWCEPCFYCGAHNAHRHGAFREHVIPRSWPGGHSHPGNIVLACRECNNAKGVNSPATWFFLLLRRGAVVGGATIWDRRATHIWDGWADEIRLLAEVVNDLDDPVPEGLWSLQSPMYGREDALNGATSPAEGPAAPVHAEDAPRRAERNTGASR